MIDTLIAALKSRLATELPATHLQLAQATHFLGQFADPDYLRFLSVANGAEGDLGDFGYIQLWGAHELEELNEAYATAEFLTDTVLIGSDGGGEAFGFSTRGGDSVVIMVPFIPMEDSEARVIASSFVDLLKKVVGEVELS